MSEVPNEDGQPPPPPVPEGLFAKRFRSYARERALQRGQGHLSPKTSESKTNIENEAKVFTNTSLKCHDDGMKKECPESEIKFRLTKKPSVDLELQQHDITKNVTDDFDNKLSINDNPEHKTMADGENEAKVFTSTSLKCYECSKKKESPESENKLRLTKKPSVDLETSQPDVTKNVTEGCDKKLCINDNPECKNMADIVAKSRFSVEAPEFVPKGAIKKQLPVRKVKEVLPHPKSTRILNLNIDKTFSMCYTKLISEPGDFDDQMLTVIPILMQCIGNDELIHHIGQQVLFDSLRNSSYAYFAVKIYVDFINAAESVDSDRSEFVRNTMLNICSKYRNEVLMEAINNTASSSYGNYSPLPFLLFLAELYLHLEVNGRRLIGIAEEIIEICQVFMKADHFPLEQRLVEICTVMKLAGRSLDEDVMVEMNKLLGPMWIKMDREVESISESTYLFVDKLIDLRYSNWDVPMTYENEAQQNNDQPQLCEGDSNLPILYGPDGVELTQEEVFFFEYGIDDSEIGARSLVSPSMDDEMTDAYCDFLLSLPDPSSPQPGGNK